MPGTHEMDDADWQRLIRQLRNGDCTPFLGAGACAGTLPSGAELSRELAGEWGYPGGDDWNLTKVSQFGAVKFGEHLYVKEIVCDRLRDKPPPKFSDMSEPHGLIAGFPLRVYLTTNYDDYIYQALVAAGKTPNAAICAWNSNIDYAEHIFGAESGWKPEPERPLVYHLHGSLSDYRSIVITEDDYLEFLDNIIPRSQSKGLRVLPPVIRGAMTRNSLLFIGYSLQDWTFRFLFERLLRAVPGINQRRHISVQMAPEVNSSEAEARALRAKMARYYEKWKVSVYWGTAAEFCAELRKRMESDT